MRPSVDATWLEVARVVANRSTCVRRAVGCVLVNARGHVLATGYNGVAAGEPHCNETMIIRHADNDEYTFPNACPGSRAASGKDLDACHALHAEQNALIQCHDPFAIHTAYVTTAPCVPCAKLLRGTSCQRVIYLDDYAHAEAARQAFLGSNTEGRWFFRFDARK